MLIDKYLPVYQFNEVHSIIVEGNIEDCYNATMNVDLSKSKIIELLFRLRGLPFHNTKLPALTNDMRFTLLEEIKYSEFLYAFVVKKRVEWIKDREDFLNENKHYNTKVAWSFSFDKLDEEKTKITTETRVYCLNKKTKFIFSIYWFFVKPFSGLIRMQMLNIIKNELNNNYA